jgi:hypothetical protein
LLIHRRIVAIVAVMGVGLIQLHPLPKSA